MLDVLDKFIKLILLFLVLNSGAFAQEIQVRGGFVQDHFEVGDNVDFWLSAKYPEGVELVLPDSLYDFTPFEYAAKKYYPSKLKSGNIHDTAIYTLQCYEIGNIQYLKLPAIILANGDSSLVYSKADSILFNPLVAQVSDTTQLKTNLKFANVNTLFNFPMMWIVVGLLVLLGIIFFLVFGNKILRAIKLRKLKKEYIKFSDELTELIRQLKSKPEKASAELAISKWKRFAERLENKPYTKLTSKEILKLGYTNELDDPLRKIDRFIYSEMAEDDLYKQFHSIEDFTQHRYEIAKKNIEEGNEPQSITSEEKSKIQNAQQQKGGLGRGRNSQEVQEGGRFVIYQYNFSIIIMTFKRSSKVYFVPAGSKGILKGLKYSLISFVFGWWGIPWGFIYTPQSLFINFRGGKDVTYLV